MPNELISTPAELVAAREALGVSAEDIQRQLKIHIKQLDALERGEWDSLPELSFVRGMLRSYGRAINVNVEPLLATIGGHGIATDLKSSASLQEPIRSTGMLGFGNGGSGNGWSWLALMAAGVAALALFFGKTGENSRVPSWLGGTSTEASGKKTEATQPAETTTTASAPPVPEPIETGHRLELSVQKHAGRDDRLTITITPEVAIGSAPSASGPAASANAAATELPLKISTGVNSWVRLSQADGLVLLLGAYRAGAADSFMTKGTINLTTDYPARIRLEFDGKPVPLELPAGAATFKARLP